ncbi:hypothetical protein KUL25_18700 [Rhodobacteraceae bacterium N5(2021)]|uniref:Phage shock protein B n=1 Tax=Gymnodinialimonas phycosphaerae TaxID=2841589 RepID=A0A975TV93_9RHOB|nr:hypothetical protein [Gymnodinialimonas phycosphaerae]MBY4894791.1 hypothetical protein [Gymnodinialimonas phycosphaerae]
MLERSTMPFTMTIIILLVILVIFAMKYGAQLLRDRAEAARSTDIDVRLTALTEQNRDLEKRVSHIEAMLREVE